MVVAHSRHRGYHFRSTSDGNLENQGAVCRQKAARREGWRRGAGIVRGWLCGCLRMDAVYRSDIGHDSGFAGAQETVFKGIVLLAIYSLGLAVPFLLTSLGVDRFLAFYGRFRRHLHTVEVISGVLLIAIGVLISLNNLKLLSGYLSFLNRFAL